MMMTQILPWPMALFIFSLLLSFPLTYASDIVIQVPGDFTTIQEAVDVAPFESTVEIGPGQWKEHIQVRSQALTLRGSPGETFISAVNSSPILKAENSELFVEGLTFSGGWSNRGSGAYLVDSDTTLSQVTFSNNRADEIGGGLYVFGGNIVLEGVHFLDNHSTIDAGGAAIIDASTVIHNTEFQHNSARKRGGALAFSGGTAYSQNLVFLGNTAASAGAVATLSEANWSGSQIQFINNIAEQKGGALEVWTGDVALSHVVFEGNRAVEGGGLRVTSWGELTVENAIFHNNVADDGGAAYVYQGQLHLDHATLVNNHAFRGGGIGVSILSANKWINLAEVNNSIFSDNVGGDVWFPLRGVPGRPTKIQWTDFYSSSPEEQRDVEHGITNLELDPLFLEYGDDGLPLSYHLSGASPLIDMGNPLSSDIDGSPIDLGAYGGEMGGEWDLDNDGYPTWFWPGEYEDAPEGINLADWDQDDNNPQVQ